MSEKFKNLTTEDITKLALAGAAVIWSVGYFIRSVRK